MFCNGYPHEVIPFIRQVITGKKKAISRTLMAFFIGKLLINPEV